MVNRIIYGCILLIILFFAFIYESIYLSVGLISMFLSIKEIIQLKKFKLFLLLYILMFFYISMFYISRIHVLYTIIVAALADTSCYVSGKLFGKHKFTSISPNKTIEGLAGGLIVFLLLRINILYFIISILGDLFFSYVKRKNKIKDFSNIIPGHGGILDRIDSISACIYLHALLI